MKKILSLIALSTTCIAFDSIGAQHAPHSKGAALVDDVKVTHAVRFVKHYAAQLQKALVDLQNSMMVLNQLDIHPRHRGSQDSSGINIPIDISTPDNVVPELPYNVAPNGPGDVAPNGPGDIAPSEPGDVAPNGPGDVAPSEPGDVAPNGPGDVAPSEPGDVAPDKPASDTDSATGKEADVSQPAFTGDPAHGPKVSCLKILEHSVNSTSNPKLKSYVKNVKDAIENAMKILNDKEAKSAAISTALDEVFKHYNSLQKIQNKKAIDFVDVRDMKKDITAPIDLVESLQRYIEILGYTRTSASYKTLEKARMAVRNRNASPASREQSLSTAVQEFNKIVSEKGIAEAEISDEITKFFTQKIN